MMNLEKHGLTRLEIAVRFRLEEKTTNDLLDECAVRPPRLKKKPRPADLERKTAFDYLEPIKSAHKRVRYRLIG